MPPPLFTPILRDHLALALISGLGPKLTRAVLQHFGSPSAVLHATAAQLELVPLIGAKLAHKFAEGFRSVDVEVECNLITKHDVSVTLLGSDDYPARLADISDCPVLLYHRGMWTDADRNAIGIVGSRSCTSYGKRTAERIATGLVNAGYTVISGLARGIDGVAHEAALKAGGRTIAVLAGGLAKIYPPEHTNLAEQITKQGAILTETPMTMEPQPGMFPARNRIISALSRAVVVIEANAKSGALITATHAAEQGREVFAVPGNVDSAASAGCLELIRKGARLVRDADDILEDVRGIAPPDPPPRKPATKVPPSLFEQPASPPVVTGPPPGLDDTQHRIWEALESSRHADELSRELGIPASDLAVLLMKLEMKKAIRRLPGNKYERR